ncbi:MAG: transporter substrate-binding domain-containing protein [Bacteroidota bacterium]
MKNKSAIFLIAMIVTTLIGCGDKKTVKINSISDLKGKVIGIISSGTSTKSAESMVSILMGAEPKEIVYFNRGSDIFTALLSGKIDAFPTMKVSADYGLKRNSNLKAIDVTINIEGGIIMAVRSEDLSLKVGLDSAITTLRENGTLKTLEDQWITNLPATNEPSNKEIPKIEGAKTVYVGVSGDLVPLDYIAADGRPAGYNVAILTEIGKLLKLNFEFVSLEAQAKFAALLSKKIDVIFYHVQSENTPYFNELKNNNWIGTKPYYFYNGGCFIVKK